MEVKNIKVLVTGAKTVVKAIVQPAAAAAPAPVPEAAVVIPRPQLEVVGGDLAAYFLPTAFNFSQGNAELFLFRWKNQRRKKSTADNPHRRKGGWVHPANFDWETKWAGWGFFSGRNAEARITEYAIPGDVKNFQRFMVPFNKYMFWKDGSKIDVNVVEGIMLADFDKSNNSVPNQPIQTGVGRRRYNEEGGRKMAKVQKFALAVAVDNPVASKTNGVCPKLFGPLSEPFFTRFTVDTFSNPGEITGIEIGFGKYRTAHNA